MSASDFRKPRLAAVSRESWEIARSQPITSLVIVGVVCAIMVVVLLTTGRTVAGEEAIIASMDTAGTRSVTIRIDPKEEISPEVVADLQLLTDAEWVAGFGQITEAENVAVPGGPRIGVRSAWGDVVPHDAFTSNEAVVLTESAVQTVGLTENIGGLIDIQGREYDVVGVIDAPFLGSLALQTGGEGPVVMVIIRASNARHVHAVQTAALGIIGAQDPASVSVETSSDLANLRMLVQGHIGEFSRNIIAIVFGITTIMTATMLSGLVVLHRKDFGRRRALGASRPMIMALVLGQVGICAAAGVVAGAVIAVATLSAMAARPPSVEFFVALGISTLGVALASALIPAVIASRRDPLTELRVA